MATRRIISQEKTILEKDDSIGSSPAAHVKSDIAPAVPTYAVPISCSPLITPHQPLTPLPRSVIMKLLAFTLGMIVLPIGSYFVTVNTLFKGMPLLSLPNPHPLSPSSNTQIPPTFPQPIQAPTYPYAETGLTQHPRQLDLRGRPRSHHGQRGSDRVHLRGDGRGPVGAAARAVKRRQKGPVRGLVWFSSWSCTHNIMYFLSMSQRFIHNNTWLESRMRAHRCWALFYLGVGWNCSASDA